MSDLDYVFAETGGGEEVGFNEPVTTAFKGDFSYLAREAIQNIIDARVHTSPLVRAEFELINVMPNELPKLDRLIAIFEDCRDSCRDDYRNEKAASFFQSAVIRLKTDDPIPILRIGDYNTVGLIVGDNERSSHYHGLMKSSGQSSKTGDSGGSYGLGKGAYTAASSFRTFFAHSVYGSNEHVFQGKLRLVAHRSRANKILQNTGSFGLPGQRPVRDKNLIPPMFDREKQGTDIYIVGFDAERWETQIMKSVLSNFWLAIWEKKLELKVGLQTVTKDTIGELMERYFPVDQERGNNPLNYFLAYTDENKQHHFTSYFPTLGEVHLYIRKDEDLYGERKIAHFRSTGMEIYKSNRRTTGYGFAAVFLCDNEVGNKVLRMTENPQHNAWKAPNAEEEDRGIAERAMRELAEFERVSLRKIAVPNALKASDMPGIEKYFPYTDNSENIPPEKIATSDEETAYEIGAKSEKSGIKIIRHVRVRKKLSMPKPTPPAPNTKIVNVNSRSFATENENGVMEHTLILRGEPREAFHLNIKVGTDDSSSSIDVKEAKYFDGRKLECWGNSIFNLNLDDGGAARVTVSFEPNDRYALNLTAYKHG